MRYVCLACDYDGTIARNGAVAQSTVEALQRVKNSGRRLVLVTGRELRDLLGVFERADLFDRIVAENGGVLYRPSSQNSVALGEPPPKAFIDELMRRGVTPLSQGQCVVATWHPQEVTVLEVIREMSLELQIIFNKNAVMVMPSGTNKGSGLQAALGELELSPHNIVAAGDAENDHAFFGLCECSVAVSNALPALKEKADWVTAHSHGAGVEELIEVLLKNDLRDLTPRLQRHEIELGTAEDGRTCTLPAYGSRLLIAGPSGSGKSTTVAAIVERLCQIGYQVCLIDPEGDYDDFDPLATLGGPDHVPATSEILDALKDPKRSLSVNLLGVPLADRPTFFQSLLMRLQELRLKTGRPHWIVIDEAHHLLPAELATGGLTVPKDLESFALVTVHPDQLSLAILSSVSGLIAVGGEPERVIEQFNSGTLAKPGLDPRMVHQAPGDGVLVWQFGDTGGPRSVKVKRASSELRRHQRKYAVGELGHDRSFYFGGRRAS
jgi:hydroxymethylpyrimidine pyrophosphatase-like HAD family hydrolase/energy-coupling factor transporter ATP-binding protein EcfA2